jgi:hypothetical protein
VPSGIVSGSVQVDVMSTTNIARLATTGSNVFTGALSGTTATFSDTVTATQGLRSNRTTDALSGLFLRSTINGTTIVNNGLILGKESTANNAASIVYTHVSDGNTSNRLGFGFWGSDNLINLTAEGRLGIGVTSPLRDLDVNGNIRVRSGAIDLSNDFNNQIYALSNAMYLKVNGTERLTISSTGAATFSRNVSDTTLGLDVSNSGTYGLIGVRRGTITGASAGINYYTTTAQKWFTGIYEGTDNFGFYNAASGNFPMVITTGSRVGIGTTNPSHPLHVASSTVYQILAEQTSTDTNNTGAYATFYAVNNAGLSQVRGLFGAGGNNVGNTALRNAVYYGAQSDHSVVFMTNDAERMKITNIGDVSMTGTGAIKIQSGTTAQRPTAATGQIRYNTSFNFLEYYDGSNWVPVVGQTSPGSSASNPAESANEIKTYNPNATNGLYWIRQVGTTPLQAYCVFTDFTGAAIAGGPWTVPLISNDSNGNFSGDGPSAAATFLSKCQAIGIASPGRGMENTRTTTEVYGAWLAVKRALWNQYPSFIANGDTGGNSVLRMPIININGEGGASDHRLIYNTSLGTHIPPNESGDACDAGQLFCGWWGSTDITSWRTNNNTVPGPEDWAPSNSSNTSYSGNGLQSTLTVCVYK